MTSLWILADGDVYQQSVVFECWAAGGVAPPVATEQVTVYYQEHRTVPLVGMLGCTEVRIQSYDGSVYLDDLVVENARPLPPSSPALELSTSAVVITFDEYGETSSGLPAPSNYKGLNLDNFSFATCEGRRFTCTSDPFAGFWYEDLNSPGITHSQGFAFSILSFRLSTGYDRTDLTFTCWSGSAIKAYETFSVQGYLGTTARPTKLKGCTRVTISSNGYTAFFDDIIFDNIGQNF